MINKLLKHSKALQKAFREFSSKYETITQDDGNFIRVFLIRNNKKISPWHDVNIWTNKSGILHMVNEIPLYFFTFESPWIK